MKHASLWLFLMVALFSLPVCAQVSTTLLPSADAFARNGTYGTTNYGAATQLDIKSASASGYTRNAYLKFSLPALEGTIQTAKLRLYGKNGDNATPVSIAVYPITADGWSEGTLNYNNRPAYGATPLHTTAVNGTAQYYEWDITTFVKAEYSGDKVVSLALKNKPDQNLLVAFNSKEAAGNKPQLVITLANRPPVVAPATNLQATAGSPFAFTFSASDPDQGQVLTFSLPTGPEGATIDGASGAFSWTPAAAGTYVFTVKATDNGTPALSGTASFTVQVANPPNQPPLLQPVGSKQVIVNEALTFTATASDPDADQSIMFELEGAPQGAAIDPVSGLFSWTPTQTGSFTCTIKATDNGDAPLSAAETITIQVDPSPVNRQPVLAAVEAITVFVGQQVQFTASATDPDPDQSLFFSFEGDLPGAAIDPATGQFSWTPAAAGEYTLVVKVSDNGDPILSDAKAVAVNVVVPPPNQAPVLAPIPNVAAVLGQPFTLTLSATDPDTWQTKTFILDNGPEEASLDPQTGVLTWTPAKLGMIPFTFKVVDNGNPARFDTEDAVIGVISPNAAPVIQPIGNKTLTLGESLNFTAVVVDPDADQTMNFYLIDGPEGAVLDAATGQFSWTPTATGTYTFSVHVSDNSPLPLSDEEQITVTVNAVNEAPVLSVIGNKEASIGMNLSFTAKANDPNTGQTKTFSLTGAPAGAAINASTGVFTWIPAAGGTYTFIIRVSDNGVPALSDEEEITVTVNSNVLSLLPAADAFVRNGNFAGVNYGITPTLEVKGTTTVNYARNAYLKFSLASLTGTVTSAKLRLYGANTASTQSVVTAAYAVAADSWSETSLTWNNAPAAGVLLGSVTVNAVAQYYDIDVTAFVQQELAGDKVVSIQLRDPGNKVQTFSINSRENSAFQPQLEVTTTTPPSNLAPVLAPVGNKILSLGSVLTFTASASDPDAGQTVSYTLGGAPAGATIDASTGDFAWQPAAVGNYVFRVVVKDNGNPVLGDEEQIAVTVIDAVNATTFANTVAQPLQNPGLTVVPVVVSGLPEQIDTLTYGLQSVSVQINHPSDNQLTLKLQSPDGREIFLFRKSPGANIYTTFDGVAAKFIDNNEIANYTGSFNSNYRPRQDLSLLNNGQNPNGTWNLLVSDDVADATSGTVSGVSLVFGDKPAKPLLSASTLPIVKIYTDNNVDIPDDPKVLASMYIIDNGVGSINQVAQNNYRYQGKIAIEIRGNSSASLPAIVKKQYGFETRSADGASSIDVSLMGMPAQSDWILSAVFSDKSLMRNLLTYQVARDMGQWASRTRFCEVIINDEYRGVFIFQEKIKRGSTRVPIEKMSAADTTMPNVQGGYIFSVDDLDPGDKYWWSKYPPAVVNPFKYVYPKAEDVQPKQRAYLEGYVGSFEDALHGDNFQDPVNGFRKYADDKSFIDFFIINEFTKNNDAYRFSTYFHKKRNAKITAGPVWDFDRAMRNENSCSSFLPEGFVVNTLEACGRAVPWWWQRMLQDVQFKRDLVCRWNALRQTVLSKQRLFYIIDSSAAVLNQGAQQRNFTRWNIFGKYVPSIPRPYATSFQVEIDTLKQWLGNRLDWIDQELGACSAPAATAVKAKPAGAPDNPAQQLAVYPSPFRNQVSVSFSVAKAQQVQLQLLDMSGKVLLRKWYQVPKGAQVIQLNLSDKQLSKGLYLLQVKGETIQVAQKLLKE